ncbi:hypothetical protein GQ44DRAFT_759622 [Phaeosphaeriaceae sp. PMI808]|nr:hypothetical protein GQ44DRAFT_759622 [Phaeosphaeriaceae sp. PMI808]
MAKSKKTDTSVRNKAQNMMQTRERKQSQVHTAGDLGKDPWTTPMKGHDTTAARSTAECSQASLKSQLVLHFGGRQRKTSKANKKTITPKVATDVNQDNDIALPTPIHATLPCKLVAADGRVEYIYTPIGGFEHLFKVQECTQEKFNHANPPCAPSSVAQSTDLRESQTSAETPQHSSATHESQRHGTASRGSRKVIIPARRKAVPKLAASKDLKRTRSIAQGLSQPRYAKEASDHDDNEDDDEVDVAIEMSRTFHIGDMEGLKNFFRHRIDELTMKPVRGMVTRWVKQLEPKRKGGYGPYHRLLPADAPADTTPPWWPQDVPYVEPAHLDKDGLLTLAVDLLLQHRDTAIDQVKRQVPWTAKLRQIAKYEIEITPPDQYSSSKSPLFSRMMQERAENSILPSLFDVSQSYEDYVFQHNVWEYAEGVETPRGKDITWQFVPRPPKQFLQRKRVRRARSILSIPKKPVVDIHSDESGDTEVDEDMERISNRICQVLSERNERKKTKEVAANVTSNDRVSQMRTVRCPTPVPTEHPAKAPAPALFAAESMPAACQRSFNSSDPKPTLNTSFDDSMNGLHLYEDVQSNLIAQDHHEQAQRDTKPVDGQIQYHNNGIGYASTAFHPTPNANPFYHPGEPPYSLFLAQNFIDPSQLSLFNTAYQPQIHQPNFQTAMATDNIGYSYENALYTSATLGMTPMPAIAAPPFNGLHYNYEVVNPVVKHE